MVDKKSAPTAGMVDLFDALAKALADRINGEEFSPALAEVARKFLSDNSVNCDLLEAAAGSAAGELAAKSLPFRVVDDEDSVGFGG